MVNGHELGISWRISNVAQNFSSFFGFELQDIPIFWLELGQDENFGGNINRVFN